MPVRLRLIDVRCRTDTSFARQQSAATFGVALTIFDIL